MRRQRIFGYSIALFQFLALVLGGVTLYSYLDVDQRLDILWTYRTHIATGLLILLTFLRLVFGSHKGASRIRYVIEEAALTVVVTVLVVTLLASFVVQPAPLASFFTANDQVPSINLVLGEVDRDLVAQEEDFVQIIWGHVDDLEAIDTGLDDSRSLVADCDCEEGRAVLVASNRLFFEPQISMLNDSEFILRLGLNFDQRSPSYLLTVPVLSSSGPDALRNGFDWPSDTEPHLQLLVLEEPTDLNRPSLRPLGLQPFSIATKESEGFLAEGVNLFKKSSGLQQILAEDRTLFFRDSRFENQNSYWLTVPSDVQ